MEESSKPIVYDLYTGLHGWLEAFLAEGYTCVGYDIEDMCASLGVPRSASIEFRQRDVRSIHGSELKDAAVIVASPPCQAYSYRAMPWKRAKALPPPDNTLFNECFRIQREASEAAGHHIPMVVENVRGAQKWVGKAQWNYGSFYLWGDVPALMPRVDREQKFNPDGTTHGQGSWFAIADSKNRGARKVPGMDWVKNGKDWFGSGENCSLQRKQSSRSNSRKAASAMIAKIPFPLAVHIAQTFKSKEVTYE